MVLPTDAAWPATHDATTDWIVLNRFATCSPLGRPAIAVDRVALAAETAACDLTQGRRDHAEDQAQDDRNAQQQSRR